ncbi:ATP-binding protein [Dyadobacter sp. CY261]|uniref:ATP-binding protein n=1 Tax=Dyadobacter sp. CY261 TaxID=2907203 RepID=UPI001F48F8BD|nr:ATP-binding protein [Dyadobacter sp. CY261]MCF0073544.1 ATP-binding protein [Dyadobacter sp. CY261]
MIRRNLQTALETKLYDGKAIILTGARQVGKTTLLHSLFGNSDETIWLNGDEADVRALFENATSTRLKNLFAGKKNIVIDEAQRISDIGIKLKLITDNIPGIQLVATGSSSFEFANKINEPLTGRKWEYRMFPLSFGEMVNHHGLIEERRLLPQRLLYGYYPDIVNHPGEEKDILKQLSDSYLYKDILTWENIQKPEKLLRLLQALAFQVGSQVSFNELGTMCGLDNKTVEKYINLLEQVFIIFRLGSFSRNLRNELKSSRKIYFYDNGIRNALIANFSQPELRTDIGALWENFIISERMKFTSYNGIWANQYYWRTKEQNEIDYLEDINGKLHAYEFKWNAKAKAILSKTFSKAYPGSDFQIIHPGNFDEFIL